MKDEQRDDLNRFLCEQILGRNWAERAFPDYCSSLDLVSEVEKKVRDKTNCFAYTRALTAELSKLDLVGWNRAKQLGAHTFFIATASAEQRAAACRAAWEGEK